MERDAYSLNGRGDVAAVAHHCPYPVAVEGKHDSRDKAERGQEDSQDLEEDLWPETAEPEERAVRREG